MTYNFTTPIMVTDWRAIGAKRYGSKGWAVAAPRRFRGTPWQVSAGPVKQGFDTFWRVSICEERNDRLYELAWLRADTETDALESVAWLAAVAAEAGRG